MIRVEVVADVVFVGNNSGLLEPAKERISWRFFETTIKFSYALVDVCKHLPLDFLLREGKIRTCKLDLSIPL